MADIWKFMDLVIDIIIDLNIKNDLSEVIIRFFFQITPALRVVNEIP